MSRDKRFFVICLIAAAIILLGAVFLRTVVDGAGQKQLEKSSKASAVITIFPTYLPNQPDHILPTVTLVPIPEGGVEYTVQPNDSLLAIALKYGVTDDDIAQLNHIKNKDQINPGDRLVIPRPGAGVFTPTPANKSASQIYRVQSGDTLGGIAFLFGISVKNLMEANSLSNTRINTGQTLVIPSVDGSVLTKPTTPTSYPFSALDASVADAYPRISQDAGFRVHYQPGSMAEREINDVMQFLPIALAHINARLGVQFSQTVDVYLADTLFAPPDQSLGGKADGANKRLFVQYNSKGRAWRRYLLAHELTHVVAWNTYGPPASAMLSEGLAVYAAERFLLEESNKSVLQMCRGWQIAGLLPNAANSSQAFRGHAASLDSYFAAGCFVQYLMSDFDANAIKKNYSQPVLQIDGKNTSELAKLFLLYLEQTGNLQENPSLTIAVTYSNLRGKYEELWNEIGVSHRVDRELAQKLDEEWLMMLRKE